MRKFIILFLILLINILGALAWYAKGDYMLAMFNSFVSGCLIVVIIGLEPTDDELNA